MSREVRVFDSPDELAAAVAADFLAVVSAEPSGPVHEIALTGGTIAVTVHEAIAALAAESEVDWSRVQFWFGDERFVARDSSDRNAVQARSALLDSLPDAIVHDDPCPPQVDDRTVALFTFDGSGGTFASVGGIAGSITGRLVARAGHAQRGRPAVGARCHS